MNQSPLGLKLIPKSSLEDIHLNIQIYVQLMCNKSSENKD